MTELEWVDFHVETLMSAVKEVQWAEAEPRPLDWPYSIQHPDDRLGDPETWPACIAELDSPYYGLSCIKGLTSSRLPPGVFYDVDVAGYANARVSGVYLSTRRRRVRVQYRGRESYYERPGPWLDPLDAALRAFVEEARRGVEVLQVKLEAERAEAERAAAERDQAARDLWSLTKGPE